MSKMQCKNKSADVSSANPHKIHRETTTQPRNLKLS